VTEDEPIQIATLAGKYGAQSYNRWRFVKGLLITTVDENDALALRESSGSGWETLASPRESFQFVDRASKEEAFMNWFQDAVDEEVIEPVGARQLRSGGHWTGKFIRGGYKSGLRDAGARLREKDIDPQFSGDELEDLFNLPLHTDQVGTLYRRSFSELEGIGSDVGQEISRILSDGLTAGENPRTIGRTMNSEIDGIGITRSRALARTELSRSYNLAAAQRYQQNGIEKVRVVNSSPCHICRAVIDDNPYSAAEAATLIPATTHPNCECGLSPVTVATEAMSARYGSRSRIPIVADVPVRSVA
jgi:hypothetical protein